jgi:hypothetical protein
MDAATKKLVPVNANMVTLVQTVLWAAARNGTIGFATIKVSAEKLGPLAAR